MVMFLDWSNKRMKDNGYMLYITPTSWMSPQFLIKKYFIIINYYT